ncbi:glutathione binding-like protein [Erythrobacter mangrovi]|uniref:Glutathione S-transferase family protein n=1 Tax=Erythrobacter mangrovi TaxID=2739433 RepID=A0A7D4BFJ6_9SPHN|nr:glutathione binding-like protein [Erythrobacter mangrovi]QKG70642.1 glutathione S-transferase family protein [Erythrobacter mangrovi]
MKLYYLPGACSFAVHVTLNEVGAEFAAEKIDNATKTTESGADFRKINPLGYVPALELDDGEVLIEAPAILQHLADGNPDAGLAPANGTIERTRLQQYLNFTASEFHKAFVPFFSGVELTESDRAAAEAKVAVRLDYIESLLADGRPYLLGDTFTVADTYTYTVATWTGPTGIGLAKWPNLQAYVERISTRPSVRKAMIAEGLVEG